MSDHSNSRSVKVISHQLEVQHQAGEPLLLSLENAQINIQYHCREGYCGACRTRLIKGNVEYTTAPLAFIDDDEILPCCCEPATDIEISIE
ncbi:class I ribonucleotide reductase maintenance protein YfaE [Alteromonas sp. a30]|uniref:class I ribonucleotide reductase maintenance protein YfaE n=1 Tax=Alteromonas sp. a30 TaxID=2730917 RepID=UPI00227E04DA|nr:class I ribonucleotide reductase maintenance protein YfaE [Alteromonas sp. a30]MCY7294094.1 2Fe-2S ferredoxin-like protein [Alteromonas sp. a30]